MQSRVTNKTACFEDFLIVLVRLLRCSGYLHICKGVVLS